MIITGRVWKFGDDVNTDVIFPGRYTYELMSDEEMGKFALEDADSAFNRDARAGDIIVAGKNWGCGSSREQAVKSLKARGVAAVIAGGFSRIFYRNALNEGLLTITAPEAVDLAEEGETIQIDVEKSRITVSGIEVKFQPYPQYLNQLVSCGGLVPYTRRRVEQRNGEKTVRGK